MDLVQKISNKLKRLSKNKKEFCFVSIIFFIACNSYLTKFVTNSNYSCGLLKAIVIILLAGSKILLYCALLFVFDQITSTEKNLNEYIKDIYKEFIYMRLLVEVDQIERKYFYNGEDRKKIIQDTEKAKARMEMIAADRKFHLDLTPIFLGHDNAEYSINHADYVNVMNSELMLKEIPITDEIIRRQFQLGKMGLIMEKMK